MGIHGVPGLGYSLECDVCGNEADTEFECFLDAVEFKKDAENGWKSRKVSGQWQDVCPECQ